MGIFVFLIDSKRGILKKSQENLYIMVCISSDGEKVNPSKVAHVYFYVLIYFLELLNHRSNHVRHRTHIDSSSLHPGHHWGVLTIIYRQWRREPHTVSSEWWQRLQPGKGTDSPAPIQVRNAVPQKPTIFCLLFIWGWTEKQFKIEHDLNYQQPPN